MMRVTAWRSFSIFISYISYRDFIKNMINVGFFLVGFFWAGGRAIIIIL